VNFEATQEEAFVPPVKQAFTYRIDPVWPACGVKTSIMRSRSKSARIGALIAGLIAGIPAAAFLDALVQSVQAPPTRSPAPPLMNVGGTELFGFERAMAHARRDYRVDPEPLTGIGTPFGIPAPPAGELQQIQEQQDPTSDRPAATSPPSNRPPSLKRRPKMAAQS
jgi:hypothetical protein